mmetsp:Transcript_554/g.848  ORF Transcript_554/g.848 Transcript_554/m.848 type:complete len:1091 (-) Transcript_554:94-3366(-)
MGTYNSTMRIESSSSSDDEKNKSYSSNKSTHMNVTMSMSLMGTTAPPLYEAALIGNWNDLLKRLKTHPGETLYSDKCKNTPLHLVCRRQPPAHVVEALLNAADALTGTNTNTGTTSSSSLLGNSTHNNGNVNGNGNCNAVNGDFNGNANSSHSSVTQENGNCNDHHGYGSGKEESLLERTTVDGLTALHFACYCGASSDIVGLLLGLRKDSTSSVAMTGFNTRFANQGNTTSAQSNIHHNNVNANANANTSANANANRKFFADVYMRSKPRHKLDRRGRSPLHCACAGFRTKNRPAVVHSLLRDDPGSAILADEKGRTPFSLMYDDYAEEIDEVLHPSVTADHVREMCTSEGGSLGECWKILILLLKASYLGYVEDDLESALDIVEVVDAKLKSSFFNSEEKKSVSPPRNRSSNSVASVHSRSSAQSAGSGKSESNSNIGPSRSSPSNQFDLTQPHFQLLHAAAASLYFFPHGFFQLILKTCGHDRVKERDTDFHLPLHLAAKATPPASSSANIANPNRYSISTSFHGLSSVVYEEKLGVTLSYFPDASKSQKNKQYTTTSFQPSESFAAHQTPILAHLLDIYPEAASIPDDQGKYPVLLAIESGKSFEFVIEPLLDAFPHLLLGSNVHAGLSSLGSSDSDVYMQDPGDSHSNAGMEAIQASLMHGLTSPSVRIRNETAMTIGYLMKRLKKAAKDPLEEFGIRATVNPKQFKVDEFLRGIIRTSGRYGTVNARRGQSDSPDSAKANTCNNEWTGIQATMLQALSAAMSNLSAAMIEVPSTPQLALDVASNMLKHEDCTVRECAALCIGSSLELLGEEMLLNVVSRVVIPQRRSEMLSSTHSLGSSVHSFQSLLSRESSVASTANAKAKNELKIHSDNLKLVQMEQLHNRHGRALACFRILTSAEGNFVSVNDNIFQEATQLMQSLMLDDEALVREAACLAMGAILGQCHDTSATLKIVRHTLLKCMRTTEDLCVQIALARGLMVATRMKPHVFICKAGTPILEGALMLAVSSVSPANVQKMYHGFLWLALGIGDKESAHYGLSEYMSLAEGENGKIMMSLVTKTLAKIESVRDILWSSTVYCEDEYRNDQ